MKEAYLVIAHYYQANYGDKSALIGIFETEDLAKEAINKESERTGLPRRCFKVEFKNFTVRDYAHASRFIASWLRSGGKLGEYESDYELFRKWLVTIGVTPENVKKISFLAENGKMELENMAAKFLKEHGQ